MAVPGIGGADDLIVVGELCVDLIIRLDGDIRFGQHEQLVHSTDLVLGSSSAITACGAAALGVRTAMASVRGDDEFGAFVAQELATRGVGTQQVRVEHGVPTGASTHLSRSDGDRAILTSMGTIGRTRAADVELDGARHLHVGSYFLQRDLWADAVDLFAAARARGMSTSLDGNFDPTEQWDCGILALLGHVDIFFANEQELRGVTGESSLTDAAASALERMPEGSRLVCKLGAEGALVHTRRAGRIETVRAETPVAPGSLVDTVGAGDSLAAGFIAAHLSGSTTPVALAVACGTASTRGAGGVGAQPDRATAEALASTVRIARG
ncbi:sugar kinase [Agromyces rhizosphaerae]|uniref:Sugar kinase n=1 Tax=Agromyces rhizosphaerae TaxID=88374 RepID=A0A9W6CTD4_9MICO|nr:carbohydrate kinase family protein [Agromyces rhizosphaerae]GLI26479.1 sugar kinase [Agromyces rhizosphaerae]